LYPRFALRPGGTDFALFALNALLAPHALRTRWADLALFALNALLALNALRPGDGADADPALRIFIPNVSVRVDIIRVALRPCWVCRLKFGQGVERAF
jgi:hypothetical protein